MKGKASTMRRGSLSIKPFPSLAALALTAVVAAGLLGGCGSGGNSPTAAPSRTGRATFTIHWPQTTRLIPSGTMSIQVVIAQGSSVVASQVVNRPTPSNTVSVLNFPTLPVGNLIATATAFPQANAQGVPLATGSMPLIIQANTNTPITITMMSTINQITIAPVTPATVTTNSGIVELVAGQSIQFVATARDSNGNVVPVVSGSTLSFTSSSPAVAAVAPVLDASGLATSVATVTAGMTSGLATITFAVTETDVTGVTSSKTGTLQVEVLTSNGSNGARFAYITNNGDNTVTAYQVDRFTGALSATGTAVTSGTSPQGIGVAASGQFVYVVNSVANSVSGYSINNSAGTLTPFSSILGAPFPVGTSPVSIAVAPQGGFIFVANSGSNTVSQFSIDPNTGSLIAIGTPISVTGVNVPGQTPQAIAVDPSARFVFTANSTTNNVSAFSIIPGIGALMAAGDPVSTGGSSPQALVVDTTGQFLFVINQSSNTISAFSINAGLMGTGALTLLSSNTQTGASPIAIATSGNFVYVANRDANSISVFAVGANGSLTPSGTPVPTGTRPVALAVDPVSQHLYATNFLSNTVSQFSINPGTGALTPLSSPTVATGPAPSSIITTTGASGNLNVTAQ